MGEHDRRRGLGILEGTDARSRSPKFGAVAVVIDQFYFYVGSGRCFVESPANIGQDAAGLRGNTAPKGAAIEVLYPISQSGGKGGIGMQGFAARIDEMNRPGGELHPLAGSGRRCRWSRMSHESSAWYLVTGRWR